MAKQAQTTDAVQEYQRDRAENITKAHAHWRTKQDQKRTRAAENRADRAQLSDQQQLSKLDRNNLRAKRERARLLERIKDQREAGDNTSPGV